MLAWNAQEEWKLQAFRDFDEGAGPDLYKLAYAKSFRIDPSEVDKDHARSVRCKSLCWGTKATLVLRDGGRVLRHRPRSYG